MNLPEPIRLPDEISPKSPAPYRRRQEVASVRRGQRSLAAGRLKAAAYGLLLLIAACGVYGASRRIMHSRQFSFSAASGLTVEGNHYASRTDILAAMGFDEASAGRGQNLFSMNLAGERNRIQSIPWVKSATVARILPDRLLVKVTERKPLAFVDVHSRLELVDGDGTFLVMPAKASLDFPVLYGLDSVADAAQRKALLATYLRFLGDTGDSLGRSGWTISEGNLSDPSDLRLLMVEGRETVLVHFGDHNFDQRFKTFLTLAPKVFASNPRIDSIDLRYKNEVIVDPFRAPAAKTASPPGKGGRN